MQIVGGDGEEHKKMFYWFVLVSFNTRTKVKHLGVGVGTFPARLRGAV